MTPNFSFLNSFFSSFANKQIKFVFISKVYRIDAVVLELDKVFQSDLEAHVLATAAADFVCSRLIWFFDPSVIRVQFLLEGKNIWFSWQMLLSSFEIGGLAELLCLRPCRLPFQIFPLQRISVSSGGATV